MHSQPPVGRQSLRDSSATCSHPVARLHADIPVGSPTIRGGASRVNNKEASKLIIETTPSGKPYLKDYPNLFFNLTHTDNLILISLADSPVGVDVERLERNADKEAILKHFFSEREQQSYFSQPENQRQLAFFKGWTRKEALLKATGEGLSKMNDYEVSFEPVTDKPIINIKAEHKFNVKDFTPKEGYAACLAILEK